MPDSWWEPTPFDNDELDLALIALLLGALSGATAALLLDRTIRYLTRRSTT
jgi:hypothetical protein